MRERLERARAALAENELTALLVLAVVALTVSGIGSRRVVGLAGCVLCAVLFGRSGARWAPWALAPLLGYALCSALSSLRTYGDVFHGFFNTQMIFPLLYVAAAYLKAEERLLLRRCLALWAGFVAALGALEFAAAAQTGQIARLETLLGNPNALGAFLVLSWFLLRACAPAAEESGPLPSLLRRIEPLLLTALALTLSMGSFLALLVGVAAELLQLARRRGWRAAAEAALLLAAKGVLGMGPGFLLYFSAVLADVPQMAYAALPYLLALAHLWPELERFLAKRRALCIAAACGGLALALTAVLLRGNAPSTFLERLQMMQNGLLYLWKDPLLGVGPYRWRALNLADGGYYFNTWHIHNAFLHVGVELGVPAMLFLLASVGRGLRRGGAALPGLVAFTAHNCIDVSFFYPGITALALLAAAEPGARKAPPLWTAAFHAAGFALFVCTGFHDAF